MMHIPHPKKHAWSSAKAHSRPLRSCSETSAGVRALFFRVALLVWFPPRLSCVFAGIHLLLPHTRLTLHVAAPAHLAVAGQAGEVHGRVVAPSAAQALAAGVLGAGAAPRARGVARGPAEAGGLFQVDQVGGAEVLAVATGARQLRLSGGGVGDAQHAHGVVVAILQQAARVVERSQLLPTGPHGAGAGDAMTLAGGFQAALHGLEIEKEGARRRNVKFASV